MFRLFGFDVRVRLGFILFVGLIAFINPGPLGLWLGAALAVFTLLHELGHAVAARSAGAGRRRYGPATAAVVVGWA